MLLPCRRTCPASVRIGGFLGVLAAGLDASAGSASWVVLACVLADVGKVCTCAEGCVWPEPAPAEARLAPGPAPRKAAGSRSGRSAYTLATAAARTIHPTARRGAVRSCTRACVE